MAQIKTYRDLLVWQKSMVLVTGIYKITKILPSDEVYGLAAQMRRSAVSIPSNIAEGYGRNSTNDYSRFLRVAIGSLYELQTHIEISRNLEYFGEKEFGELYESAREIERMLSSLIRRLNSQSNR